MLLSALAFGGLLKSHYEKPDYLLRLCPSSDIDMVTLYQAVNWWSDRGVWFVVDRSSNLQGCVPISYSPEQLGEGYGGLTIRMPDGRAMVLLSDRFDDHALAHELGHVAGYDHTPLSSKRQLMNGSSEGWRDTGIRIRPSP